MKRRLDEIRGEIEAQARAQRVLAALEGWRAESVQQDSSFKAERDADLLALLADLQRFLGLTA